MVDFPLPRFITEKVVMILYLLITSQCGSIIRSWTVYRRDSAKKYSTDKNGEEFWQRIYGVDPHIEKKHTHMMSEACRWYGGFLSTQQHPGGNQETPRKLIDISGRISITKHRMVCSRTKIYGLRQPSTPLVSQPCPFSSSFYCWLYVYLYIYICMYIYIYILDCKMNAPSFS